MTLPVRSTPLAPGAAITGPVSSVCRASNQTYSIAAVSGATSYTWTVPSGATITNNSGRTIKGNVWQFIHRKRKCNGESEQLMRIQSGIHTCRFSTHAATGKYQMGLPQSANRKLRLLIQLPQ